MDYIFPRRNVGNCPKGKKQEKLQKEQLTGNNDLFILIKITLLM
jgi:hypothetical protein